jgi:hypothetical protein
VSLASATLKGKYWRNDRVDRKQISKRERERERERGREREKERRRERERDSEIDRESERERMREGEIEREREKERERERKRGEREREQLSQLSVSARVDRGRMRAWPSVWQLATFHKLAAEQVWPQQKFVC